MIPDAPNGMAVYDLGRELSPQVPHHPFHPPFLYSLTKSHGDVVDPFGNSASADIITMGTHTGTHIDGLAHFSQDGKLHDNVNPHDIATKSSGYSLFGMESVRPIVTQTVLADVPGFLGVDELEPEYEVTAMELAAVLASQGTPIHPGGALLIRTGWGREWPNLSFPHHSPGPGIGAITWAWNQGARLFGSDTIPFEQHPVDASPVHRELLIARGAHIIEAMDLEEVARAKAYAFLMVLAPLKIRGATGSPVRPVAIVT